MGGRSGPDLRGTEDCLQCRLIGSGAMAGLSAYFYSFYRMAPAQSSLAHRRAHAALSVAFATAAIARFVL